MSFNQIISLLSVCATVIIIICVIVVYNRNKSFAIKGSYTYIWLLLSFACGNIFYIGQHLSTNVNSIMLMFKCQSALILVTIVMYVAFFEANLTVTLLGNRFVSRKVKIFFAAVLSIICVIFVILNPGNVLFRNYYLKETINGPNLIVDFSILFYLYYGILYLVASIYLVIAVGHCFRGNILLKQMFFITSSVLLLIISSAIYFFGFTPVDLTNIFVAFSALLLTYSVVNYGVMDTIPYLKHNMFFLLDTPLIVLLADDRIEYVNSEAEKILHIKLSDVKGKTLIDIDQLFPVYIDGNFEIELHRDRIINLRFTPTILSGRKNKQLGKLLFIHDITNERSAHRQVEYLRTFDNITGLMNSEHFNRLIDDYHSTNREKGLIDTCVCAISISNANKLRGIVTTEQHAGLCQMVAKYISRFIPNEYILSRFGDSEYYFFSRGINWDLDVLINAFVQHRHKIFTYENQSFTFEFIMGICVPSNNDITSKEAIANASFALQSAYKKKLSYDKYDFDMANQHELYKKLLTSLNTIDFKNDFYLAYQPVVDIRANNVHGAEALLRWRHPIYGELSPAIFIPIFEEANEMVKLGLIIIEKACDALREWQTIVHPSFKLSINISKKQLEDPYFFDKIVEIINRKGVNSQMLDFEITETATVSSLQLVIDFCNNVRKIGATVSLDDFGSGDTSISFFTSLGLDKVKLDGALARNSHIDQNRGSVIKYILDLCNKLNIKVVVEQVEHVSALAVLKELGFSLIQGYIFSRPLLKGRFIEYYQAFDLIPTTDK